MSARVRGMAGFSLVELLVALAVFAALAAAAYGGLATLARTRAALAAEQQRFADVLRTIAALERDLEQAISRPVRDRNDALLASLQGDRSRVELTTLGFANPQAQARSNLERVAWGLDGQVLRRLRWPVLDRAPNSRPQEAGQLADVEGFALAYLGEDRQWRVAWPPPPPDAAMLRELPRAVEVRLRLRDLGEIRRVVELPQAWPLPPGAP